MANKEINLLEDIQKGISPSYMGQFSKINNLDIDSVPGIIQAKYQLSSYPSAFEDVLEGMVAIGVYDGDDKIAFNDLGTNKVANLFDTQAVTFTTTDTLPDPLAVDTIYYLTNIDYTGKTVQVATTIQNAIDGTQIDLTDSGTGTHTLVPNYMKEIKHYVTHDSYGDYAIDKDNVVWYKSTSSNWTVIGGNESGSGIGMNIWKGYLFVMRATEMNVYGPLSAVGDTAAWNNSFAGTLTSNAVHPSIVAQDDMLYIGCGTDIASLQEDTTFDPANTDTYTLSTSALDIPNKALFLEELAGQLMIGTEKMIYSWDFVSPSFNYPITLNEKTRSMKVYNNLLYFIDYDNVIWATNGSSVAMQGKLPQSDYDDKLVLTDKIGINDSKLYFGAYSLSATDTESSGVYSFNPSTGVIYQEYKSQSGETVNVRVDCYDEGVFTFYEPDLDTEYEASIQEDNETAGRYTTTFFETGLKQVGSKRKPANLAQFEIVLAKELSSSLAVDLEYRYNLTDSWTSLGSISFTNEGAVYSGVIDNSEITTDQIQFKGKLTSRGTGFDTTPKLKAIYVR